MKYAAQLIGLICLVQLSGCDRLRIKSEHFEPDLRILEAEVQEIYAKERNRDSEGLLRHWEPCRTEYESDLTPLYAARAQIRARLSVVPPLDPRCTFKVHGYGTNGRFVDAHCEITRNGRRVRELLALAALYPSKRKDCKYSSKIVLFEPRIIEELP